jgi:hypothetical protein
MLTIPPTVAPVTAPLSPAANTAAERGRLSLEEPRLGRDLSQLTAHRPQQTPLNYAMNAMVRQIPRPDRAIDGEGPACPLNKETLWDHVRATLGMDYVTANVDPGLARYLNELSKNEPGQTKPITFESLALLAVLYTGDRPPLKAGDYIRPEPFMEWLNEKLAPGTVRHDLIPRDDIYHLDAGGYSDELNPEIVALVSHFDPMSDDFVRVPAIRPSRAELEGPHPGSAGLEDGPVQWADRSAREAVEKS